MVELHDAFTIAELLYYEALGLAPHGEAVALLKSGATQLGGRVPVNPSGGLLAKGHPLGATGVAQMVEVVWQLQGRAGARQVDERAHRPDPMHRRRHRRRRPRGFFRPPAGSLSMNTRRFDPDHVAVVTGAARGIGFGIAEPPGQAGPDASPCSTATPRRWTQAVAALRGRGHPARSVSPSTSPTRPR